MENMTNFSNAVAPKSALALLCATPATDLRTAIQGQRMRVTATTTGMGHIGFGHTVFGADYVPGSPTWSPPI